jgi:CTP synthase (UTP-ammonia lyase)
LRVSGRDAEGAVRAIELDGHPFFVATLFQPERSALAGRRHPLVKAFVTAAACEQIGECGCRRIESRKSPVRF